MSDVHDLPAAAALGTTGAGMWVVGDLSRTGIAIELQVHRPAGERLAVNLVISLRVPEVVAGHRQLKDGTAAAGIGHLKDGILGAVRIGSGGGEGN
jgi:hypothetical protein